MKPKISRISLNTCCRKHQWLRSDGVKDILEDKISGKPARIRKILLNIMVTSD